MLRFLAPALAVLLAVGCAGAGSDGSEHGGFDDHLPSVSLPGGRPVAPQPSTLHAAPTLGRPRATSASVEEGRATTRLLHVGGLCSTGFVGGKGKGRLAQASDMVSVDVPIDQRDSMSVAVPQMRAALDEHCTGEGWCAIVAYSNGGAVVSKTLSVYDSSRWNLLWVLAAASNEGGSELSGSYTASLGDALGLVCNLSNDIAPSDHRPAWNHDDTGGVTFYLVAGHSEWWYTGKFPDYFSGMANDGAVAYHSSVGLNDTYFVADDEPWACYRPEYHYAHHEVAYRCEGYALDHDQMKMQGIVELGG